MYVALFIALLLNSSRYDYLLRDSRFSVLQNFKVFTVTSLVKRNQLSFLWLQNSKMEELFLLKHGFCKKQVSNISVLLSQTLISCLATCMQLPKRAEMSSFILVFLPGKR